MIPLILLLSLASAPDMTQLELAVWTVETGQCSGDCPAGDGGAAIGPLQIHLGAWTDVKRPGEKYSDCEGLIYSVEVFRRYQDRYAVERRLGRKPTPEDRARIWNGGPNGYKKSATVKYWNKVKTFIRNIQLEIDS
jgi:hypothetical protein